MSCSAKIAKLLATAAVCASVTTARGQTGQTTLVSVDSAGIQGNSDSYSGSTTSTSSDGRFVAFWSYATNLVPGDTNGYRDVFVRDRQSGTTERVSVATGGAQADNESDSLSTSADGRFVAFASRATNLVAGDMNGVYDVFVRDCQSGTTQRVSVATGGAEGSLDSNYPSISADGNFVAFYSASFNLVAGDTNGSLDVFVRDRLSGTTERVSVATGGAQGNWDSDMPGISADGRFVAFEGFASNLVPGDTNGAFDVFVRDRQGGTTERVSVATGGAQGNFESRYPSISANGNFVAYRSFATNLVAGDTNGFYDIFVRDRLSGTTERVSVDSLGVQANSVSTFSSISADGRFVAFDSLANNLAPGDTSWYRDIFVRDRPSGTTERVSVDSGGAQGNSDSNVPSISADGHFVAFQSNASNLVLVDTNGFEDVFVHDCTHPPVATYCTAKVNSLGCTPSIGMSAAPSASAGSGCTLSASNVIGNKNGLFFHSTNGALGAPFHGGFLCVKPPLKRHSVHNSGGSAGTCSGLFTEDFNVYIATGTDPALVAGADVWLQNWSRDPAAPFTDSLTDAVTATIQP